MKKLVLEPVIFERADLCSGQWAILSAVVQSSEGEFPLTVWRWTTDVGEVRYVCPLHEGDEPPVLEPEGSRFSLVASGLLIRRLSKSGRGHCCPVCHSHFKILSAVGAEEPLDFARASLPEPMAAGS